MEVKKKKLTAKNRKGKNEKPTFSSNRKSWFFKIELPKVR